MAKKDKALVLPGGGVLGIAWEIGVLAGLKSKGVELTDADYILATSAGSVVAVQILTIPIERLYRDVLDGVAAPEPVIEDVDVPALIKKHYGVVGDTADGLEARKIVGRWALQKDRVSEAERMEIIKRRLPSWEWPEKPLGITVIQADNGEFKIFDRKSGVSLLDAVAASCCVPEVWPAVTIDGVRYYDGGIRSNANIDMVEGYGKVLAFRVSDWLPETADVRDISDTTPIQVIRLDDASRKAYGADPLLPGPRVDVAKAGFAQGERISDEVRAFWD
jgi:NTE family protein